MKILWYAKDISMTLLRFIFLISESPAQAMSALRKGSAPTKAFGCTKSIELVLSHRIEATTGKG